MVYTPVLPSMGVRTIKSSSQDFRALARKLLVNDELLSLRADEESDHDARIAALFLALKFNVYPQFILTQIVAFYSHYIWSKPNLRTLSWFLQWQIGLMG